MSHCRSQQKKHNNKHLTEWKEAREGPSAHSSSKPWDWLWSGLASPAQLISGGKDEVTVREVDNKSALLSLKPHLPGHL